jgi:replicative DNA helicase
MEFRSQGVPVVVSRTKIDSFYFEEGVVHFFRSGDSQAMAEAILDVVNNKSLRKSLADRGYEYVKRHGWDQKKKQYLDLIDSLSTELFADVQPALESVSVVPWESQKQPTGDPLKDEASELAVQLDDTTLLSSLKGK